MTTVPQVVSLPAATNAPEETMLREDGVREIMARLARGDGFKRIARELGVDATRSGAGDSSEPGPRDGLALQYPLPAKQKL